MSQRDVNRTDAILIDDSYRVGTAVLQGHVVKLSGLNVVPAGANEFGIGVAVHSALAGETVKVAQYGLVPVKVDGDVAGIAVGDRLQTVATGKLRKIEAGASKNSQAFARNASTADGDFILAFVDFLRPGFTSA
jgi:hypothetical protein